MALKPDDEEAAAVDKGLEEPTHNRLHNVPATCLFQSNGFIVWFQRFGKSGVPMPFLRMAQPPLRSQNGSNDSMMSAPTS